MRAQISLTVAEAKALIAEAIASLSDVKAALAEGRLLLKGGTTVSAIARRLLGEELRISGRVSPRGTKATSGGSGRPHSILVEKGQVKNIDDCFIEAVRSLRPGDIAVIGANAVDASGRAAMLLGSPLGGNVGQGLAGIMSQGCRVLIACGLEKLIPGSIEDAIKVAGIYSPAWSMGMATGLAPVSGDLVTEQKALAIIARVTCTVIAAGGIDGAEGATTMVIEGEPGQVKMAVQTVLRIKGAVASGCPVSLAECRPGAIGCSVHQACAWRRGKGGKIQWPEE